MDCGNRAGDVARSLPETWRARSASALRFLLHDSLEGGELAPRIGVEPLDGKASLPQELSRLQDLLLHLGPEGEQ